jgi:hypothetical protein
VVPLALLHVCIARQKSNGFNPLISVRNFEFLHGKADCLPRAARTRPVAVGAAGSIVQGLPKKFASDHATMASSVGLKFPGGRRRAGHAAGGLPLAFAGQHPINPVNRFAGFAGSATI